MSASVCAGPSPLLSSPRRLRPSGAWASPFGDSAGRSLRRSDDHRALEIHVQETGGRSKAETLVQRVCPQTWMHDEIPDLTRTRLCDHCIDQPSADAAIAVLVNDEHTLHIAGQPAGVAGLRNPFEDREPRHADHIAVALRDIRRVAGLM